MQAAVVVTAAVSDVEAADVDAAVAIVKVVADRLAFYENITIPYSPAF
jgi:hypothetical protein